MIHDASTKKVSAVAKIAQSRPTKKVREPSIDHACGGAAQPRQLGEPRRQALEHCRATSTRRRRRSARPPVSAFSAPGRHRDRHPPTQRFGACGARATASSTPQQQEPARLLIHLRQFFLVGAELMPRFLKICTAAGERLSETRTLGAMLIATTCWAWPVPRTKTGPPRQGV